MSDPEVDVKLVELWDNFIATRDAKLREALVVAYMPLVRRVAIKARRTMPGSVELDELISYGSFGLLRAIDHYDPSTTVRFETYAIVSIRGVIADELRSLDWAPRSLRKKQRDINSASASLEKELSRAPTAHELAEKLQWSEKEIDATTRATGNATHRSLDECTGEGLNEDDRYEQLPAPGLDPQESHAQRAVYEQVANLITRLPILDQLVMTLYYFEGLTLQEIGLVAGIPESRASQVHVRAALAVREELKAQLCASDAL